MCWNAVKLKNTPHQQHDKLLDPSDPDCKTFFEDNFVIYKRLNQENGKSYGTGFSVYVRQNYKEANKQILKRSAGGKWFN